KQGNKGNFKGRNIRGKSETVPRQWPPEKRADIASRSTKSFILSGQFVWTNVAEMRHFRGPTCRESGKPRLGGGEGVL
ncbi:MAG: hypothetical protein R3E11_09045, partial [Sphingobium sp.]